MRTILALDTATEVCSAALLYKNNITEENCEAPRSHAKTLLPMIDKLLVQAGITVKDLDLIALTNGPGSFTGIRIGVGVAQGLAYGASIPVFTASTLEVMAYHAVRDKSLLNGVTVLSALDARMGEVYWAEYKRLEDGRFAVEVPPKVSEPEHLEARVASLSGNVWGVGHGWSLIGDAGLVNLDLALKPNASSLLELIKVKEQAGEELALLSPQDPIEPMYLRNEVTWEKRKRIRNP